MILEQTDKVGATWHQHYDRLHLHTSKANSALPFLPLLRPYPRYPSRRQMIDYFETYAQHFHLEPRFGQEVVATDYHDGEWRVQTQDTLYRPNVNSFLQRLPSAYDDNGVPIASGHESTITGLYFCGFHISATGMLREIAHEAKQISADISRKCK